MGAIAVDHCNASLLMGEPRNILLVRQTRTGKPEYMTLQYLHDSSVQCTEFHNSSLAHKRLSRLSALRPIHINYRVTKHFGYYTHKPLLCGWLL